MIMMKSRSFNSERLAIEGHVLARLPREDLDLIAEFVLVSGSLKDLGKAYGVSYPTIRARLDQVIERLRAEVDGRPADPVAQLLANLVQRGELGASTARAIRETVREAMRNGAGARDGLAETDGDEGGR